MLDQATTPDPILESFKAAAKPPETIEELVAILATFVRDGRERPLVAFHCLAASLEGRTEAWEEGLDEAWRAEAAA